MFQNQLIWLPICVLSVAYGLHTNEFASLPKIRFEDLKNTLNTPNSNVLNKLKDEGGKIGAIIIDGLGGDYKTALQHLIFKGQECIDLLTKDEVNLVQMPDSSHRKTYATMDGHFPDCFKLRALSDTFDNVDGLILKILSRIIKQDSFINSPKISYQFEGELVSLDDAPVKEHVHVYDRSSSTSTYMVPFHVDNGLYLILTPFSGHGIKIKLSNNKVVSTEGLETDSVIVLFGRGLTDWLLQNEMQKRDTFHAVPHAVPTTSGKTTVPRTVYARMKVAQPSAIPIVSQEKDGLSSMKTFEEVFLETLDNISPSTAYNDLCPFTTSGKENEIW